MAPRSTTPDEDRRRWRTSPPPPQDVVNEYAGQNDVASLLDKERALDAIASSMIDDIEELNDAATEAADALCDWEEHLARETLQLHVDDVKSNEHLRKAMALVKPSTKGVSGRVLYRRHVITRSKVDTLKKALDAKGTVSSDLQTLVNGLRKATGLT